MIDGPTFAAIMAAVWVVLVIAVLMDGTLRWKDRITIVAVCGIMLCLSAAVMII